MHLAPLQTPAFSQRFRGLAMLFSRNHGQSWGTAGEGPVSSTGTVLGAQLSVCLFHVCFSSHVEMFPVGLQQRFM